MKSPFSLSQDHESHYMIWLHCSSYSTCCMTPRKSPKIGDVVCCHCPDGTHQLPAGLPNNARAKVIATYVGVTYVYFEGNNYVVPNACVHDGSDDSGTLASSVRPTDLPLPAPPPS